LLQGAVNGDQGRWLRTVQRRAEPRVRTNQLPVVEHVLQVGIERQRAQTFLAPLPGRGENLRNRLLAAIDLFAQQQEVLAQLGVAAAGMVELKLADDHRHRRQRRPQLVRRASGEGAQRENLLVAQNGFADHGEFAFTLLERCRHARQERRQRRRR
jgi:hypothetical protein